MAGDWTPIEIDTVRKAEVLGIARITGMSRHEVLGALVDFWGWVGSNTVDGCVDTDVDTLVSLFSIPVEFFDAMTSVGWLIVDDDSITIPNADHWLTEAAKSRLQRNRRQSKWRKKTKNVDEPVDAPVSTKASTREEKRREENTKKSACVDFDSWWEAYPHKVGKVPARKSYAEARKQTDSDTLLAGVAAYVKSKPQDRPWCNPATWLNQGRWEDQPAVPGKAKPKAGLDALTPEQNAGLLGYTRAHCPDINGLPAGQDEVRRAMRKHLQAWRDSA